MKIAPLPEGNHLVCKGAHFLRLGLSGLNPLGAEKRGHKVSQQCSPMCGVTSQGTAGYMMSHIYLKRIP